MRSLSTSASARTRVCAFVSVEASKGDASTKCVKDVAFFRQALADATVVISKQNFQKFYAPLITALPVCVEAGKMNQNHSELSEVPPSVIAGQV